MNAQQAPEMYSIGKFYKRIENTKELEVKAAAMARKVYRFAKKAGIVEFITPPQVGVGATQIACKAPAKGVQARALVQWVIYFKPENSDGWQLRVDIFGHKAKARAPERKR